MFEISSSRERQKDPKGASQSKTKSKKEAKMKEKYNREISTNINDRMLEKLNAKCEHEGLKTSSYLRRLVFIDLGVQE